ncbi:transposase [Alphaproteobacteria bacterium]
METNGRKRSEYKELVKDIPPERLVYTDESGIGSDACRDRGWGLGKKSGKYCQRTNIIAGLVNNNAIAPIVFNGSCDTRLFEVGEIFN